MESKNHWKGLIKSLGRHIDPEKEDQIECVKIGKCSLFLKA